MLFQVIELFRVRVFFHSLELLNIPQFLFCRVVRIKTAPVISAILKICISDHTHQLANAYISLMKCQPAVAEK